MENLVAEDGELVYIPGFLPESVACDLFARLSVELNWQDEVATLFGRQVPLPRRVCWYGDEGAIYRYSGLTHYPQPWTERLAKLKASIEQVSGRRFNSVLANLYRDGQDSMGWHSDQEKVLGENPFIASLSLGAARLFRLRHNRSGETVNITLANGSLLLMGGSLQHHWRHCVPKTRTVISARINLTFRLILDSV
jgi:alkylated DNA repair dioxygenase AlkB